MSMIGGMQDRIREKLAHGLQPLRLDVVNESGHHAGHAGDDGSGESHFRVMIVSSEFSGKNKIERQRIVYGLLAEEISHSIHALSIKAMTPEEYNRV
jgi:BolA protein